MINTISPLSFLLYTYINVSLDPDKKKIVTLIIKKKIEFIIYQKIFLLSKIKENFCAPQSAFFLWGAEWHILYGKRDN